MSEALYKAVQSGKVKMSSLNEKGRQSLKQYMISTGRMSATAPKETQAPPTPSAPVQAPQSTARSGASQFLRGIGLTAESTLKGATGGILGPGGYLEQGLSKLTGGKFQPFQPIKPETTAEKILAGGSEMGGAILPITKLVGLGKTVVNKVVPAAATGTAAKVARTIGPEVIAGGAYEGGKAALEGKPVKEVAKEAATGAAIFGGIGAVARGAEVGIKKLATSKPTERLDALAEKIRTGTGTQSIKTNKPIAKSIPIEERTFKEMSKPSVKSYQWENPQVKPFVQAEAYRLREELASTIKGQRSLANTKEGTFVTSNKRFTSEPIERILEKTRATYKEIDDALQRIIKDEGAENTALAKKVELVIDDNLSQGFKSLEGIQFPPDKSYLDVKSKITGRIPIIEAQTTRADIDLLPNAITSQEIQATRQAIQSPEDLLKVQEAKNGTTVLYSGIPVEAIQSGVDKAGKNLADSLGKASENIKVVQSESAKQPGILTSLRSPTRVAKDFPEAKIYIDNAVKATERQERLRNVFTKRLNAVDEALSGKGVMVRLRDPLRRGYKENKELLNEILLSGDALGKRFTNQEIMNEFGANESVIRAYNLLRASYDRAYSIASKTKELRGKDPVAYREGYIPHFFHNWFITVDGEMAASAKTLREAIGMSNQAARAGKKITIIPKKFEHPGEASQAAVLGDMSYFRLKNKVEKEFSLSTDEAKELLEGVARMKGRSRFVGNFMERKGVKGWEQNLDWVNRHYFNMVSRYAALDPFKSSSIRQFERQFGSFDKEHKGIAGYVKNYINDVNGNPTPAEDLLNNSLSKIPGVHEFFGKFLGDRYALQLASGTTKAVAIAKLGMFNISSAMVNASQLLNAYASLGAKYTQIGVRKAYSKNYRGLIKQLGIDTQIGIESGSGYSKAAQMGKVFNTSIIAFHKTDNFLRRVTGIGAYSKGIKEGMSKIEAMSYAKEVVSKTQFDYSIADAPSFLRRSGPIGQVLFQFKKFPVKQLEFIGQLKGAEKARFWVPFALIGGYFAFPGFELLNNTAKNMFGVDPELELKKHLMSWAGDDPERRKVADTIMYGISAQAGVDISKRVGAGDFIPSEGADLLGPAVSTVIRSAQLASKGEWLETLRAISPAPGNLAVTMKNDGVISDPWNRGRLKMELDTGEQVAKMAGFMPVRESVERDVSRVTQYQEKKRRTAEQKLIDQYIAAVNKGDDIGALKIKGQMETLRIDPRRIMEEMRKKAMTKTERTLENVPKKNKSDYTNIESFMGR